MKILAISDEEVPGFYEYYTPGTFSEYDLILACGDLKKRYLEFIVTLAPCPVLYVRGNHDESFSTMPPEGCICIEDDIYVHQGIRIMGLGGCQKYKDGMNFYTEKEMKRLQLPYHHFRHNRNARLLFLALSKNKADNHHPIAEYFLESAYRPWPAQREPLSHSSRYVVLCVLPYNAY